MSLRLLLSTSVASLVMVACPLIERPPGQSRSPMGLLSEAPPVLIEPALQVAEAPPAELEPALPARPSAAAQVDAEQGVIPEGLDGLPIDRSALPLHLDLVPGRTLGALSKETVVYAQPRRSSRKLGFLRQGALVRRDPEPAGHEGCSEGWYRIAPEGYVCVGKTATLDLNHPILRLTSHRPDRARAMPYQYGRARFPTPPLYTRLPTLAQQELIELDLRGHRRKTSFSKLWDDVPFSEPPDFLRRGDRVPRPFGYPVLDHEFVTGSSLPEAGFAFLEFYEHEGRRYGLTTDLSIIPLDRVTPVEPSKFHGLQLSEDATLPVVFVRSKGAYLYRGDPQSTGLAIERPLEYREAVPVTGKQVRLARGTYLETRSGHWILDEHLVRVDPMKSRPSWAKNERSWIEVSILQQTLVAYEGEHPVYTTLVSTGAGGLGDPKETHATIRGTFLIHTKHVTATMSGEQTGDEFDLRDVPYVQYFQDGYAFHAAYWHDSFGRPKSHGCINLSPEDARWLFHWTGPAVPRAWHSALSLSEGTLVYIHP